MCCTQTNRSTEPKSQTIAYMMGASAQPWILSCKDCGDDCRGRRNASYSDEDPEGLAKINDVEEPAEEHAENR